MYIVRWVFCVILGYIFYNTIKSKYKLSKKNEIKYDDEAVRIPEHLCSATHSDSKDLSFEEMEMQINSQGGKTSYITIKWDEMISWEYGIAIHANFNYTVWLRIVTASEAVAVTDVHLKKMKRHFSKHVRERQIINFSNKMEVWESIITYAIIAALAYIIFLWK